ncbi:hypothetical protein ACFLVP_02200 [Chloroflexota bacterium]
MVGLFKRKSLILALLPLAFSAILPQSCCDTNVSYTWSEAELTPLLTESFEDYVGIDYPISDFEVFLAPERLAVSYVITVLDDPDPHEVPAGTEIQVDMLVGIVVTEEGALSIEVTGCDIGGIPSYEFLEEISAGWSNRYAMWVDALESSLYSTLIPDGVIERIILEEDYITLRSILH